MQVLVIDTQKSPDCSKGKSDRKTERSAKTPLDKSNELPRPFINDLCPKHISLILAGLAQGELIEEL